MIKKLILLTLLVLSMSSVYSLSLHPNITVEGTPYSSSVFGEVLLKQPVDIATFSVAVGIGYSFTNSTAFNLITLGVVLDYTWFRVSATSSFGSVRLSKIKLEF